MVLHVFRISSTTFQIPNVLGIYADISPTIYSIALASFVYGSNSSTSSHSFSLLLPFSAFFSHVPCSDSIIFNWNSFASSFQFSAQHCNFEDCLLTVISLPLSIFHDWFGLIHSWNCTYSTLWFHLFCGIWKTKIPSLCFERHLNISAHQKTWLNTFYTFHAMCQDKVIPNNFFSLNFIENDDWNSQFFCPKLLPNCKRMLSFRQHQQQEQQKESSGTFSGSEVSNNVEDKKENSTEWTATKRN